jgi:hypothetical protein
MKKKGETLLLEPYSIYLFQQFRERNALIIAYTQTILISFFSLGASDPSIPPPRRDAAAACAALCFFYISSSSLFNGILFCDARSLCLRAYKFHYTSLLLVEL